MVLYTVMGALAAFGLLCLCSMGLLWLSGKRDGLVLLCRCKNSRQEIAAITRYRRLYAMGFLQCPFLIVGSSLPDQTKALLQSRNPSMVFFTKEEFSHYDATGNGDFAGHDRRCGISEL